MNQSECVIFSVETLLFRLEVFWDERVKQSNLPFNGNFESNILIPTRHQQNAIDHYLSILDGSADSKTTNDEGMSITFRLASGYAIQAINDVSNNQLVSALTNFSEAKYWLGVIECSTVYSGDEQPVTDDSATKRLRSAMSSLGGKAKAENDPKRKCKDFAKDCWNIWQQEPARYESKAAFARDMLEKLPELKSQPVIEGWCRKWENGED